MITDKQFLAAFKAFSQPGELARSIRRALRRALEAAEAAREPGVTEQQVDAASCAYLSNQGSDNWTFRGALRMALAAARDYKPNEWRAQKFQGGYTAPDGGERPQAPTTGSGVKPPKEGTSAIKTEAPDLWVKVYVDGGKPIRCMMIDDAIAALEALRSEPTVSEAATVTGGSRLKPKRTHVANVQLVRRVQSLGIRDTTEEFVTSLEALGLLPVHD